MTGRPLPAVCDGRDCEPRPRRSSRQPQTPVTTCQWHLTCYNRTLRLPLRTRNTSAISLYLWTDEGWLYLAVIIDLYSRLVVGWSMSERMTAQLVCDALKMAMWRRHMPTGVIVHSDRGSQYCSGVYQKLLKKHELICSMSAKGNCYDNACAESFFHSLKVEAIRGERFSTREIMRQTVFEYIEVDYNRTRRHSANGFISPEAFEAQKVA